MKLYCYLCHRVLDRADVGGAVEFAFGTFPVCKTCVEGEDG